MTQVPYRSICQRQQSPTFRLRGVEKFDGTNDANTASKYFFYFPSLLENTVSPRRIWRYFYFKKKEMK